MDAQLCELSHAEAMADYGLTSQQLLHDYLTEKRWLTMK